jgi:glycolate oxidase FAD binding subunit
MTLEAFQTALRSRGQWLSLDPADADRATMGGVLATNAYGPRRHLYGTARDLLIGVTVVTADGSIVKGGGKVVKNVAGYDLCKLFAGSWGTLGFITEATFKTSPKPELQLHRNFGCDSIGTALDAALKVHLAKLQPVYSVVSAGESVTISIGLHGNAKAVDWQLERIKEVVESSGPEAIDGGPTEDELRHFVVSEQDCIRIRVSTRPAELPTAAEALERAGGTRLRRLVVHVPSGIVAAALEPSSGAVEAMLTFHGQVAGMGFMTWERVPEAFASRVGDVWGPVRQDFTIMRGIKQSLDPNGLFSPGRFVGGL